MAHEMTSRIDEVLVGLHAQREALRATDLDAIDAATRALHAPLGRLRQWLPRPGKPAEFPSEALAALREARALAEGNQRMLQRLSAPARARLAHLAAAAPRLDSAEQGRVYAPPGALAHSAPRPQAIGRA